MRLRNRKIKEYDVMRICNGVVCFKIEDQIVFVDEIDFDKIKKFNWSLKKSKDGYYVHRKTFKLEKFSSDCITMHRFLLSLKTNEGIVDHIDGNGLNNRMINLRIVDCSQNVHNRKPVANCKSKYKGVTLEKTKNKWRARIVFKGNKESLGLFHSEELAAKAYDVKAKELFGQYAYLNFPESN